MRRFAGGYLGTAASLAWMPVSAVAVRTAANTRVAIREAMDSLLEKFGEARELISEAKESHGSVYFSADLKDAEDETNACLATWKSIQDQLKNDGDAATLEALMREHDLKFRQLHQELESLRENHE